MTVELALFFHLVGAFALVAGVTVAGIAHAAARRRPGVREVAVLLGLARWGALLVGVGGVLVLAFGLWLVDVDGYSLGEPWLIAALTLYAVALALGAAGGRKPRHARVLAVHLSKSDQVVTAELRRLLDDRASAAANHSAALAIVVILALMVWKPGHG